MNTFNGIIEKVGEVEHFTTQDGRPFSRRRVLLKTVEEFPQSMEVTLSNDLAESFNGQVGQQATAYIKFKTHPNKDNTALFNDIQAWRIDY